MSLPVHSPTLWKVCIHAVVALLNIHAHVRTVHVLYLTDVFYKKKHELMQVITPQFAYCLSRHHLVHLNSHHGLLTYA